jgi:hypothetical protein
MPCNSIGSEGEEQLRRRSSRGCNRGGSRGGNSDSGSSTGKTTGSKQLEYMFQAAATMLWNGAVASQW